MLALEITCHFNNDIWNSTDDELFEKCIGDLESDGFISRSEVKQFFTIRIKNAYPFYLLGYEKKLTAIFDYFKQLPGLVLAGRTEELTSIWILINVWRTRLNCDKTF